MPGELLRMNAIKNVLGRRRLERLITARWIEPIRQPGASRTAQAIFFDRDQLRAAIARLERKGRPAVVIGGSQKRSRMKNGPDLADFDEDLLRN
jgi:hypothetical protein